MASARVQNRSNIQFSAVEIVPVQTKVPRYGTWFLAARKVVRPSPARPEKRMGGLRDRRPSTGRGGRNTGPRERPAPELLRKGRQC
jgi:hypothetical protein